MSYASAIGTIAGIISLLAYVPYIVAIIRRKVKPERAIFLIWTLMHVLTVMSYFTLGARESVWVPLAYVIGSAIITALSLFYGREGWGLIEKFALGVALVSAIRWVYFDNVFFTLVAIIAINLISYIPGIKRRLENPDEDDDLIGWSLFFAGSILNLFAITDWTLAIGSLPIATALATTAVWGVTVFNRLRKPKNSRESPQEIDVPPKA